MKQKLSILIVLLFFSISINGQSKSLRFGDDGEEIVVAKDFSSLTSYSIELWIRPDSSTDENNIIHFSGGQLRVQANADGKGFLNMQKGCELSDQKWTLFDFGTWHHVAFVREVTASDTVCKVYLDGELEIHRTFSRSCGDGEDVPATENLVFGSYYDNLNNDTWDQFHGLMDEVRVWSTARTVEEINANKDTELTGTETDLFAYYNFNDETGSTLIDQTNGGRNGVLYGMEEEDWQSIGAPVSKVGAEPSKSLYFNGSAGNQKVVAKGFKQLVDSVYTQELWIKPDAYTASWKESHIMQFTGDYHSQLFLQDLNATRDTAYIKTQDGNTAWSMPIATGKWTHIAYVRDGVNDSASIYVNGILGSTVALDHDHPSTGDSNLVIGLYSGYESGESSYSGLMDELRIWNKALSAEEIRTNMVKELTGTEEGLVTYYDFNNQSGNLLKDKTANALDGTLFNMSDDNWKTENTLFTPPIVPIEDKVVAHWSFDEGSGTTAADISGNGKDGLLKDGAEFSNEGVSGTALQINGTGHVLVPAGGSFNDITKKISIEAWVNPASLDSRNIILSQWDGGQNQRAYVLAISTDGTVMFMLSPSGQGGGSLELYSTTAIDTNKWSHIAVTSDGDSVRIYINGAEDVTSAAPAGGIHVPTTDLFIGDWGWNGAADGSEQYNGLMDEVALYNYALDADTISAHYNAKPAEPKIVARWSFDEGSGTTAADISGNGKDGLLKDGAEFFNEGVFGTALQINGTGHVLVPAGGSFNDITKKISIEAWVNLASLNPRNIVLSQWDGGQNQRAYVLAISTDGTVMFMLSPSGQGGGNLELYSTTAIDTNKWSHIAVTSDGDSVRIYINGKEDIKEAAPSGGIHVPTTDLFIGDWGWNGAADGSEQYNGLMDELAIYNYALDADTIWAHYLSNPTDVASNTNSIPSEYILMQNYPNPFNPTSVISFALPKQSDVNLSVYNVVGEKVAELINKKMSAGYHSVSFKAGNLASGIYFYRIAAGKFVSVKKMMLLK